MDRTKHDEFSDVVQQLGARDQLELWALMVTITGEDLAAAAGELAPSLSGPEREDLAAELAAWASGARRQEHAQLLARIEARHNAERAQGAADGQR